MKFLSSSMVPSDLSSQPNITGHHISLQQLTLCCFFYIFPLALLPIPPMPFFATHQRPKYPSASALSRSLFWPIVKSAFFFLRISTGLGIQVVFGTSKKTWLVLWRLCWPYWNPRMCSPRPGKGSQWQGVGCPLNLMLTSLSITNIILPTLLRPL